MKVAIVSPIITSKMLSEELYNSQQLGLADAFASNGLSVDIYTCETDANHGKKTFVTKTNNQFNVYYLSYLPIKYHPLPINLYSFLKNNQYDIIISSEDFQLTTFYVSVISKLFKTPVVIFQGAYGNISAKKYLNELWKLYDLTIGSFVRANTNFVITKTSDAEKYMRNRGYSRVRTIPVGVNPDVFSQKGDLFRRELNIKEPIVLYVGSFSEAKDLPTLFDAFSIVLAKHDCRLLLVGYEDIPRELKDKIVECKIGDKTTVLTRIKNINMPFIYSSADIFVLPSKNEIFGMVLLESMACGTPVVSTPVPAAKDLIIDGENGLIVPFSNPEKLAEAILRVLNEDELKISLGKNARRTIETKYDWNIIAKQYIHIFQNILSGN